jgi:hypothetical protein
MAEPPKPDFLIIGSAKCGTTSLHAILEDHPECCMSRPKEFEFFNWEDRFDKGWEYYREAFAHYGGEPHVGESSPGYSDRVRCPQCAERIHRFNPDFKLIFMVRHPVEKLISTWKMFCTNRPTRENQLAVEGFEAFNQDPDIREAFWSMCRYSFQLEAFLPFFPVTSFYFSFLEDWKPDPDPEVRRICAFLGLDPDKRVIQNPEGENRADQRTVEKPGFTRIKTNPLLQPLRGLLPQKLKERLSSGLGRQPLPVPSMDNAGPVFQEFLEYVEEDARRFLSIAGKPEDFWSFEPYRHS